MQIYPATFLRNRYEFDICMFISDGQSFVLVCLDLVLNYIGCDILAARGIYGPLVH